MKTDVIIIGSGAAGLMCAIQAGQRGRSVVLLDHAKKLAEKIRISGGGRCNFTNINTKPENFISANPDFCRSALARYTPQDFIELLKKHNIGYHEKTLGQLFCDDESEAVIAMLRGECETAGVKRFMSCEVGEINYSPDSGAQENGKLKQEGHRFHVSTSRGDFNSASLVIATGGLSIPKIGATPFGYHVAEQFGIPITKLKPGLVPLTFAPDDWKPYADLTGVSLDTIVSFGKQSFRENMLVTHRGLSGPAILQISSLLAAWRTAAHQPAAGLRYAGFVDRTEDQQKIAEQLPDPVVPQKLLRCVVRAADRAQEGRKQTAQPVQRQGAQTDRRKLARLASHPVRHSGLQQGRSDLRRDQYTRTVVEDHGMHRSTRPVFHRRSGGRHRPTRRL